METRKKDRICALFFIGLAIAMLAIIPFQTAGALSLQRLGAGFFPSLAAVLVGIMGIAMLISTFLTGASGDKKETEEKAEVKYNRKKEVLTAFSVVLLLLVYIQILRFTGFIIGSILLSTGILVIFKVKTWYYYLIMYGFIVSFFFLFTRVLFVQLP